MAAAGYESLSLPLVEYRDTGEDVPRGAYEAILFSSVAAVRAIARRDIDALKDKPVFCVGTATQSAAEEYGFSKTYKGAGDMQSLSGLIQRSLPAGAHLLYPRARHVAHEVEEFLPDFTTTQIILYEAQLLDPGRANLEKALTQCIGGAVFLHSRRSAAHMMELVGKYRVLEQLSGLTLICISETVAEAAVKPFKGKTAVAKSPNENAMIELLQSVVIGKT